MRNLQRRQKASLHNADTDTGFLVRLRFLRRWGGAGQFLLSRFAPETKTLIGEDLTFRWKLADPADVAHPRK